MDTHHRATEPEDGLAAALRAARASVHSHADTAITTLSEVARATGADDIGATLGRIQAGLDTDTFRLIVGGRFNAGKSTLLNGLFGAPETPIDLGEAKAEDGVLPVGRFPTTAVLTDICYSSEPFVRVWFKNEDREDWSLTRFLKEGRVRRSERETREMFDPIRQFEVGLPVGLLKAGVLLSDSPGMGDQPDRDAITRDALLISDAALLVFRSDSGAGTDERGFAEEVIDSGCRTFKVVNLIGDQSVDEEEVLGFWWNRLIEERTGAVPTLAEFRAKDVFFVDARKAALARVRNDHAKLRDSGLIALEDALGAFLIKGRFNSHVSKFIRETERAADGLGQSLRLTRSALRMSAEELDSMIASVEPQLKLIEAQQATLQQIINSSEQTVVLAGQAAFQRFIGGVGEKIKPKLEALRLERLSGFATFATLTKSGRERVVAEALDVVKTLLNDELKSWAGIPPTQPGLQAALLPGIQQLGDDIEKQIRAMDRARSDLQLNLGGVALPGGSIDADLTSVLNTQLAALTHGRSAIGMAVGGALGAALVSTVGAKLVLVITYAVLTSFGILLNPAILLGAIIAALMGLGGSIGTVGLQRKVKEATLSMVLEKLALSVEASETVGDVVRQVFREVTNPIVSAVDQAIEVDREQLRTLKRARQADRHEKERQAKEAEILAERIEDARGVVREARNALAQLG